MRRAFTLIELLVVVSIIALLIAILLPALSRAKDAAKAVKCSSNLRQLAVAQAAYVADNDGQFTAARHWVWGDPNLNGVDDFRSRYNDPTLTDGIELGTLFPYVNGNLDIYLCPVSKDVLTPDTFPTSWGTDLKRNYVQNWNVGPLTDYDKSFGWASEEHTPGSLKRPSDMVVFSEENSFTIPGYSRFTMNDGYLLGRRSVAEHDTDCFASFHNTPYADRTEGDANASFADGHVEFVNYRQPEPYIWQNPETGGNELISATVMWTTDAIPVLRTR